MIEAQIRCVSDREVPYLAEGLAFPSKTSPEWVPVRLGPGYCAWNAANIRWLFSIYSGIITVNGNAEALYMGLDCGTGRGAGDRG